MADLNSLVSLTKRRGFIFQGSELYGGLSGTWDLGPLGTELAHNIKDLWWKRFVSSRYDMFGLSSSLLMSEAVWQASGHLEGFSDPLQECTKCKRRYRTDQLSQPNVCDECGGALGEKKDFNLMFPVNIGSAVGEGTKAYLRGENAQGMFVNFKNVLDSMSPKLPFGIAQVGKSFRNEIAPRDFIFRVREFDLAEFEYFVKENEWEHWFDFWKDEMNSWIEYLGIDMSKVKLREVPEDERAHYSKKTIDFEYQYPFGMKELYGLAYRGDYDLKRHAEKSGIDLRYNDEESGKKILPHVIEPTFGIGRTILAILDSAYSEDKLDGERRVLLRLCPRVAPVKVAVFPLLKNKPNIVEKARDVFQNLKKTIPQTAWDDNGNIGKRYRRQDEIGTPWCVTIDYQTLEDDTVTLRDRDSAKQDRVSLHDLASRIESLL